MEESRHRLIEPLSIDALRAELQCLFVGQRSLGEVVEMLSPSLMSNPARGWVFLSELRAFGSDNPVLRQLISALEAELTKMTVKDGTIIVPRVAAWQKSNAADSGDLNATANPIVSDSPHQQGSVSRTPPYEQGAVYSAAAHQQGSHAVGYNRAPDSTLTTGGRFHEPMADEPEIGQVLRGRFELLEVLGRGGMSVVFKALDRMRLEAHDRQPFIALKILNTGLKTHPQAVMMLQREAAKIQRLKHPNIIDVYDFDKDERGNYFVTMELLTGVRLSSLIRDLRQRGGMGLKQAWPLIEQMGQALAAAHGLHPPIVHSDFKPGNIFLTDSNQVKVFDFGIARAVRPLDEDSLAWTRFDAGALGALTPEYASAEMFTGQAADPRDDIFAFALIIYELLSGRRPFGEQCTALQAMADNRSPRRIKGLSRRQWRALERGLALKREDRTVSSLTLLKDLRPRFLLKNWHWFFFLISLLSIGGYFGRIWLFQGQIGDMLIPIQAPVSSHVSRDFGQVQDRSTSDGSNLLHPSLDDTAFAPKSLDAASADSEQDHHAAALEYWDLIQDSDNEAVFKEFIERFDDPVLSVLAQDRLNKLEEQHRQALLAEQARLDGLARIRQEALARAGEIPEQLLQQALKDLGYYQGVTDGLIGSASRSAIGRYQAALGAPQTGTLTDDEAVSLIQKAAEAGHAASCNTLGLMAAQGIGIPRDEAEAVRLFRLAAAAGHAYAAYNLGVIYRDGHGVERSDALARKYFEQARSGGHPQASEALADLGEESSKP